ncbi:MAG TPA: AMP-binding protein, partial [Actinomycetota bacterium]|nr:AMP-binding protein [Actinomycetota bacterium]
MNLAELLRAPSSEKGDKIALAYGATTVGGSVSFADLDAEVDRVASGLKRCGIEPGDRVAIAMPNVPHFVFAYFGILRAGAVAVPLNVMLA